MKYLLDTHVFLWSLINASKLSNKVKGILTDDNQIYVSIISFWEVSIKLNLGKIELNGSSPEELYQSGLMTGFKLQSLAINEVTSFHKLERLHKDSFDRMIIWQAIRNDMTLLSKDGKTSEYEKFGLQLIW